MRSTYFIETLPELFDRLKPGEEEEYDSLCSQGRIAVRGEEA